MRVMPHQHVSHMNEFLFVLGTASITAFLTFLGALLAERLEASRQVISAALQS